MSEKTAHRTPFTIYGIAPEGLTIVTRAVTPFTANEKTLLPGDELEIDEEIFSLQTDRYGSNWMSYSDAEQLEKWGSIRFGIGEVPETVRDTVSAAIVAKLIAERDNLIQMNPGVRKATGAALRVAALDAEIAATR